MSCVIAAAWMFAACSAHGVEDGREHPVVLEAGPLEQGESFACRIPVSVRHAGSPQLEQVNVVAEVLSGNAVLGNTGLASGRRPIIMNREEGGLDYEPVPLQFELTPDLCRRADGLRFPLRDVFSVSSLQRTASTECNSLKLATAILCFCP